MGVLTLYKYHGLGNDFLVLVDWEREVIFDAALAAATCDRHRGLGADGLLRLSAPTGSGAIQMELRNADGGFAETSGNGLRCAGLAAVHHGLVSDSDDSEASGIEMAIETGAGLSRVVVATGPDAGGGEARVEMGALTLGPELAARDLPLGASAASAEQEILAALGDRTARRVEVGNPHLVILGDTAPEGKAAHPAGRLGIERLGPALEAGVPGGVNVELVTPLPSGDALQLVTWERGAGFTLACGSGSCAAAAAARAAGLVGDTVRVRNPGGNLLVELSGDLLEPTAVLTGPAQRVATITVGLAELLTGVPAHPLAAAHAADGASPA